MKKLLFVMAATACVLSCRSVKNEGFVENRHYSNGADSLAVFSKSATADSSVYYHGVIDSLIRELHGVRQMYRDLYIRDSIDTNQYRADSVNVRDTTWMQVNADGSVTYHNYREKNTYSYQQLERYRQQVVMESRATIDSLTERNAYLQSRCDSMSRYKSLADSFSMYKARLDSVSDMMMEKEKSTAERHCLKDAIKVAAGTGVFLVSVFVIVFCYLRFFRRR